MLRTDRRRRGFSTRNPGRMGRKASRVRLSLLHRGRSFGQKKAFRMTGFKKFRNETLAS